MKKTFTQKTIILFVALAAFTLTANAQLTFVGNNASNSYKAGQYRDTLATHEGFFQWRWTDNFNTIAKLLLPTVTDGNLIKTDASKAGTIKGIQSKVYTPEGRAANSAGGNVGYANGYTGGGTPVFVENVAALLAYLGSPATYVDWTAKDAGGVLLTGPLNGVDSAAVCVFAMPAETSLIPSGMRLWPNDPTQTPLLSSAAFGTYPGMWKKVDTRFYINLGGSWTTTSDIEFDICTYDVGNSGKTVSTKMVVTLAGAASTDCTDSTFVGTNALGLKRYVVPIFNSGATPLTDKVHINVAEKIGIPFSSFSSNKIYLSLITEGQGTPEAGKHDPVVVIDNLTMSMWNTLTPPTTSINPTTTKSGAKIIGGQGQIEVIDATALVTLHSITGQKVVTLAPAQGSQSIAVPAGIYLATEKNQPTVKVVVSQ